MLFIACQLYLNKAVLQIWCQLHAVTASLVFTRRPSACPAPNRQGISEDWCVPNTACIILRPDRRSVRLTLATASWGGTVAIVSVLHLGKPERAEVKSLLPGKVIWPHPSSSIYPLPNPNSVLMCSYDYANSVIFVENKTETYICFSSIPVFIKYPSTSSDIYFSVFLSIRRQYFYYHNSITYIKICSVSPSPTYLRGLILSCVKNTGKNSFSVGDFFCCFQAKSWKVECRTQSVMLFPPYPDLKKHNSTCRCSVYAGAFWEL